MTAFDTNLPKRLDINQALLESLGIVLRNIWRIFLIEAVGFVVVIAVALFAVLAIGGAAWPGFADGFPEIVLTAENTSLVRLIPAMLLMVAGMFVGFALIGLPISRSVLLSEPIGPFSGFHLALPRFTGFIAFLAVAWVGAMMIVTMSIAPIGSLLASAIGGQGPLVYLILYVSHLAVYGGICVVLARLLLIPAAVAAGPDGTFPSGMEVSRGNVREIAFSFWILFVFVEGAKFVAVVLAALISGDGFDLEKAQTLLGIDVEAIGTARFQLFGSLDSSFLVSTVEMVFLGLSIAMTFTLMDVIYKRLCPNSVAWPS